MAPSELGDRNSKGPCRRKKPLFSERFNALDPAAKALGGFLLTDENLIFRNSISGEVSSRSYRGIALLVL